MQDFSESKDKVYHPRPLHRNVMREWGEGIGDAFLCRPWTMWLERVTERQDKEMDLLVGSILIRVRFEAAYREEHDTYAMLKCMIISIDGENVSEEEQQAKAAIFESKETPTTDEQTAVFCKTLENWGIRGNAVAVTEKYIAGHLRLIALRKRSAQKKGTEYVYR